MFSAAEIRKLKHRRGSGSGPPQVLGNFGGKFERQRGSKPDGKQEMLKKVKLDSKPEKDLIYCPWL